jgi:shikimate kinase
MSIVLIGYRGSGKTTVGRLLADRLGKPFVDIDDWIVVRAGKNIREIFEQDGEAVFRDHEANALEEALNRTDHIISVGGGALERKSNRTLLAKAGHQVFYLHCEAQELFRRIQGDISTFASRPPLTPLGGGIEEIRTVLSRREPVYRSIMTDEIDVTRLSPQQVVLRLLERIGRAD